MTRCVYLVTRAGRASEFANRAVAGLTAAGISVRSSDDEVRGATRSDDAAGCELVVVFGGDGTILRGAEIARPHDIPVLGINFGNVGFLAEAEPENLQTVIDAIVHGDWIAEHRVALAVEVSEGTEVIWSDWALNEIAVERTANMADLMVSVDGRPVSRWNCDSLLCATPTGSTAYAFSTGGPVIWPDVNAVLVVPVSAHALFSRPLVVSPESLVDIQPMSTEVIVRADGRRICNVSTTAHVTVRRSSQDVLFARLQPTPFADRLVAKFALPVEGWRQLR